MLLEYVRRKPLNTQITLQSVVKCFERDTGILDPKKVTFEIAMRFLDSLTAAGRADGTVKKYYRLLKGYYNFLKAEEVVEKNPFDRVKFRMSSRQHILVRPAKYVPQSIVRKILRLPAELSRSGLINENTAVRDTALFACLFGGGLRRSEVSALNVGDIVPAEVQGKKGTYWILILARTKAGKRQQQSIPDWAGESVTQLVALRHGQNCTATEPLFCPMRGSDSKNRLSADSIYRLYLRYAKIVGLGKGFGPHSARASAATELLISGHSDGEVQEFLRHETGVMVRAYDKRFNGPERNVGRNLYAK